MKGKYLLFLIVFYSFCAQSQTAYYDALFLRSKAEPDLNNKIILKKEVKQSLMQYYPGVIEDNIDTALLNKNPFFKNVFTPKTLQALDNTSFNPFNISSIGGLNVTNFADGLAKFLVNRTKEELSVAFFEQFKKDINKYDELEILFPETKEILNLIDKKIYQFSAYLTELRDAFIIDLNNLAHHIPDALDLDKYSSFFDVPGRQWIKPVVKSAAFITDGLLRESMVLSAGKFIDTLRSTIDHFFPAQEGAPAWDITINGSVKTIALVSASLRSKDTTRYWLTTDSIKLLVKDTLRARIYLGLLYAKAGIEKITFSNSRTLQSYMQTFANRYAEYKHILDSLISFSKAMKEADLNFQLIRNVKQNKIKDSLYRYYYASYSSTLKVVDRGLSLIHPFIDVNLRKDVEKYLDVFKTMGEIYLSIKQQKYTSAILYLVSLSDDLIKPKFDPTKSKSYVRFVRKLTTYGTFIAEIADAENSDQVEKIIAKTVLPTGSSYIKKHSVFNLSLNAYTGIYGGKQRQATDNKFASVAGVYAPVGITASWGIPRMDRERAPWSVSLFASIIDIGPLVAFRFTNYNDTLANDVNIRLAQIVSPGGHIIIGLPKLPISIGGGFNWSPLITKVEREQLRTQPNDKRPFRWQIFAAVDIPLLNFYNKPR